MPNDPVDVVRDHPPLPQNPIDPNVRVPEGVRRAAEIADNFYKKPDAPAPDKKPDAKQGEPPAPAPEPQPNQPATPPAEPVIEPVAPAPEPVQPAEPPAEPATSAEPSPGPGETINWEHRYHSMKGRHDQQAAIIQGMQQQMQDLGNELVRTQQFIHNQGLTEAAQNSDQNLLTPEDEETYGPELLSTMKRAAAAAVAPTLSKLEAENSELRQQLEKTSQHTVYTELDRDVPNWRQINAHPAWKHWLSLPDVYSGIVRQELLMNAFQAADAPRIVSIFRGFLTEAAARNQGTKPAPQPTPAPAAPAAPARQPAVSLETLAAPGRAKPAPGGTQVQPDTPVFTRHQVAAFYSAVRKGEFRGREAEKTALEQQIFAAQKAGRIR